MKKLQVDNDFLKKLLNLKTIINEKLENNEKEIKNIKDFVEENKLYYNSNLHAKLDILKFKKRQLNGFLDYVDNLYQSCRYNLTINDDVPSKLYDIEEKIVKLERKKYYSRKNTKKKYNNLDNSGENNLSKEITKTQTKYLLGGFSFWITLALSLVFLWLTASYGQVDKGTGILFFFLFLITSLISLCCISVNCNEGSKLNNLKNKQEYEHIFNVGDHVCLRKNCYIGNIKDNEQLMIEELLSNKKYDLKTTDGRNLLNIEEKYLRKGSEPFKEFFDKNNTFFKDNIVSFKEYGKYIIKNNNFVYITKENNEFVVINEDHENFLYEIKPCNIHEQYYTFNVPGKYLTKRLDNNIDKSTNKTFICNDITISK